MGRGSKPKIVANVVYRTAPRGLKAGSCADMYSIDKRREEERDHQNCEHRVFKMS